ncbi:hypothetical protein ABGV42_00880 [Paenibacillus pabuli]|uniref:hypothetical protein n=1 Tax=Paenibacillus pabuli TaxID=1472 RepID=UPI003241C850
MDKVKVNIEQFLALNVLRRRYSYGDDIIVLAIHDLGWIDKETLALNSLSRDELLRALHHGYSFA